MEEKVFERGSPCFESSQGEEFGLDLCAPGDRVETCEGLVDGKTSFMTEDDYFFVQFVRQLYLKKRNEASG